MVRLAISVEGLTEERFVKNSLVAYFEERNVFITPISLDGNINIDRVRNDLKKLLYSFDKVTTLYDFYGFKGLESGETKASLELRILKSLPESLRFNMIPYIQMYEFEGLLFSSASTMASILKEEKVEKWAESIIDKFGSNPESINNSPQTAPSKLLEQNTSYKKTTHGPNIAKEIGLEKIREKCKGFDSWLTSLEMLSDNECQ